MKRIQLIIIIPLLSLCSCKKDNGEKEGIKSWESFIKPGIFWEYETTQNGVLHSTSRLEATTDENFSSVIILSTAETTKDTVYTNTIHYEVKTDGIYKVGLEGNPFNGNLRTLKNESFVETNQLELVYPVEIGKKWTVLDETSMDGIRVEREYLKDTILEVSEVSYECVQIVKQTFSSDGELENTSYEYLSENGVVLFSSQTGLIFGSEDSAFPNNSVDLTTSLTKTGSLSLTTRIN